VNYHDYIAAKIIKLCDMELKQYLIERLQANTFLKYLGLEPTSLADGVFEGYLDIENHHKQQDGFVHGGVIASMLDMAAGFASYSLLESPKRCLTVEIKVSYYNPGVCQTLQCKGWVAKAGSRLHFAESEVFYFLDNQKIVVAKATATMAIV
jgi:uncharacterized protein (TIGR00369 family)